MTGGAHAHYFVAGVFKIDFRSAGFPDLMDIAQEWRKDRNFFELVVRGVSDKNFGIQFVYVCDSGQHIAIKKYREQLSARFGDGLYATDYCEYHSSGEGARPFGGIVELRALETSEGLPRGQRDSATS